MPDMRLGICYMVFDGEELLEFAARSVRGHVDHISVTYQTTSYFGNSAAPGLKETIDRLRAAGLIDEAIHFEPDLSLHPKQNELALRNVGLDASIRAGCTHHISSDVDELYDGEQMEYAKGVMAAGGHDFSVVPIETYYKNPTFVVRPRQNICVTFIHPVDNRYDRVRGFPFMVEETRRFERAENVKLFTADEVVMHHMSYVRRDIRKKFNNSCNQNFYNLYQFYDTFDRYRLGERVCLLPDYRFRRTVQVENRFGIYF